MTNGHKTNVTLQVAARKVGALLPKTLAVGPAVLEFGSERTSDGGSHSRRFDARWTKGTSDGAATIEIRPLSKTSTEVCVSLERPKGAQAFLWPSGSLKRLAGLFVHALGYQVETRAIEDASPFEVRRTTPELVRARSA